MAYSTNNLSANDWPYSQGPATAYGGPTYEEPTIDMEEREDIVFGVNPAVLMGGSTGEPQGSTSKAMLSPPIDVTAPGQEGGQYALSLPGQEGYGGGHYPVRSSSFQSYAPRLVHSYSTSSLPPELSPASTASYSSPPSSASSYSGFQPSNSTGVHQSHLLPAAHINDPSSDARGPQTSQGFTTGTRAPKDGSWFAEMQDSFLAHQASLGVVPTATPPQYIPSPAIAQDHRSPKSFSPSPSPSPRPPSRTVTPTGFLATPHTPLGRSISSGAGPDRSTQRRRSRRLSASSDTSAGRPRRQSKLSIEVPPTPYYSTSQAGGAPMMAMSSGGISPGLSPLDGMSTLHVTAPITDVAIPSPAEMDRLMSEIGTMLGPDVLNALESPSPAKRQVIGSQPWTSASMGQAVEMGGVMIGQEDMHLLNESPPLEQRSYPASAPAWQTTFNLDNQPYPPQYQHQSRVQRSPSPLSYAPNYTTPMYAPRPDAYGAPGIGNPSLLSPPTTPLRPTSAPGHPPLSAPSFGPRRGSSVDSPSAMAASSVYGYPSVITPPLDGSSSYPPPPGPSYGSQVVLQRAPSRSPPKTPKAPRRRQSKAEQGASVAMFINYSPSDSKKLLSGVAPSGSSKRKREEEQEAAAKLAAGSAESV